MARSPFEPDARVRAKRIGLIHAVLVESRTIGSLMSYQLAADNVSRTGLLLQVDRNHKVPYRLNTLIEMTVDREARLLPRPIRCFGKVVRIGLDAERRPQFGVQIIQLDGVDLEAWESAVTALEISNRVQLPVAS